MSWEASGGEIQWCDPCLLGWFELSPLQCCVATLAPQPDPWYCHVAVVCWCPFVSVCLRVLPVGCPLGLSPWSHFLCLPWP